MLTVLASTSSAGASQVSYPAIFFPFNSTLVSGVLNIVVELLDRSTPSPLLLMCIPTQLGLRHLAVDLPYVYLSLAFGLCIFLSLISRCFQGFQNIVINHMPKGTMCFVAYLDQADADVVYQTQQNVILESNGGRGLRI